MRPIKLKKLLHSKRNHGQNKKAAYWVWENVCKWYGINDINPIRG